MCRTIFLCDVYICVVFLNVGASTSDIMGAYNSTADVSADVFENYAATDSGERPKHFEDYNGSRFCSAGRPLPALPTRVALGWIHT